MRNKHTKPNIGSEIQSTLDMTDACEPTVELNEHREHIYTLPQQPSNRHTDLPITNIINLRDGYWVYPFNNIKNTKSPTVELLIDNQPSDVIFDSGATRLCCTSEYMRQKYGRSWQQRLSPCKIPDTFDAQNQKIKILGYILIDMELKGYFHVKTPMIIYESSHSEILAGYEFMRVLQIGTLPGNGLVHLQQTENIRRLNYSTNPLPLKSMEHITV